MGLGRNSTLDQEAYIQHTIGIRQVVVRPIDAIQLKLCIQQLNDNRLHGCTVAAAVLQNRFTSTNCLQ
jgi:hypothetical protein